MQENNKPSKISKKDALETKELYKRIHELLWAASLRRELPISDPILFDDALDARLRQLFPETSSYYAASQSKTLSDKYGFSIIGRRSKDSSQPDVFEGYICLDEGLYYARVPRIEINEEDTSLCVKDALRYFCIKCNHALGQKK